ncbi:MAG: PilZ domain-containing protein [Alphaproteobacteria bacterium]|nr:PilZ domain-containing protein [Alphaproteobacteria bacterium]
MANYDELSGALGRAVFFRPERARARDFLSRHARPTVRVGDAAFPVHDLSMNGLSVLTPPDAAPLELGHVVELSLYVHGRVVFQGAARVARVEDGGRASRIGLALTRGFIDLPAMARQDQEARLQLELSLGADPYGDLISDEYRQALQRAVHFVQFYREVLGRHEARYKLQGGQAGREAIAELQAKALDALSEPWREVRLAAAYAARTVWEDRGVRFTAKALTETVLTPLLLDAPCVRRSYEKPLDYPGDYQVMLYCYNDAWEGDTVFGRVFHRLWLQHPMPSGVRTRRDFVVDLAVREHSHLAAADRDAPEFRVTSLGCGPALEVPSFVERRPRWSGRVVWTLIDQDEEALSVAFQNAQPALSEARGESSLRCLNLSFTQLAQDPTLLRLTDQQHFIGCSGLFDYLRASAARELLGVMYERLAPGGLLAVGNAIAPNEDMWSPEFVLDWSMVYRTREEMTGLARDLPEGAQAEVTLEPGEAYWYLLIRKPGGGA